MAAVKRSQPSDREQLIGALIPAAPIPPQPQPIPLASLLVIAQTGDDISDGVVLGVARVDPCGRVSARSVCAAMGWQPGQHLAITIRHGTILLTASDVGRLAVAGRNELGLPAAARQLCAIMPGSWVLLAALTQRGVMIIHPQGAVTRLLVDLHHQLLGDPDAR